MAKPSKTIVYVDGLNLYYGSVKGGANKWLDLQKLFEKLLHGNDVEVIRYCTARVEGPSAKNQAAYLKAIQAHCPKVKITFGLFKKRERKCGVANCDKKGALFWHPEEKRTDVNLAVHMVDDAYQGACERMVLVTGDTDLVPPIQLVKGRFPEIDIRVYVPASHGSRKEVHELQQNADRLKMLPVPLISKCKLPPRVELPDGTHAVEPSHWANPLRNSD